MTSKEIVEQFENELNVWLKTKEHYYHCAAYDEGQRCCLDKEKDKDADQGRTGREFIIDFIRRHNLHN